MSDKLYTDFCIQNNCSELSADQHPYRARLRFGLTDDEGNRLVKTIALLLGDRYGVGPELVARYVSTLPSAPGIRIAVFGDRAVFERGRRTESLSGPFPVAGSLATAPDEAWVFVDRPFAAEVVPLGRTSAEAGAEMLDLLSHAAELATAGLIDGIVFAPLNKQSMRLAGHRSGDELDYFSKRFEGCERAGEINVLDTIWTSRVTSHTPLKHVADGITRDAILSAIDLLVSTLKGAGVSTPKIAVAALNPHAGDGGTFGSEEIDVIEPSIALAFENGVDVHGPYPADTVFPTALANGFDGVVTMFHDQGQIALKMIGLGRGVTLLAGFPVPIGTAGHGTAYDIAGTGKARMDGLSNAMTLVARLATSGA
jgi:4-hydroxythreonine-4-phosphate dehydrogenase